MAEGTHVTWAEVQQNFHVGNACQHAELPPLETLVNPPEEPPVPLGYDPRLMVPVGRPLYGVDEDGNPRTGPLEEEPAPEEPTPEEPAPPPPAEPTA